VDAPITIAIPKIAPPFPYTYIIVAQRKHICICFRLVFKIQVENKNALWYTLVGFRIRKYGGVEMGKKILKLFLDTMLRAAVIILAVAIVVMLVLLVTTNSKNKKSADASDTQQQTDIVTEEEDPSDPTFGGEDVAQDDGTAAEDESSVADSTGASIVVINASGVSGVAASWQSTLSSKGYSQVEVGNYLGEQQSTTVVYGSDTYSGEDLLSNFQGASLGSKADLDSSLFDVIIANYDIVVIVGLSDSGSN
jgi:hypothetical protein